MMLASKHSAKDKTNRPVGETRLVKAFEQIKRRAKRHEFLWLRTNSLAIQKQAT